MRSYGNRNKQNILRFACLRPSLVVIMVSEQGPWSFGPREEIWLKFRSSEIVWSLFRSLDSTWVLGVAHWSSAKTRNWFSCTDLRSCARNMSLCQHPVTNKMRFSIGNTADVNFPWSSFFYCHSLLIFWFFGIFFCRFLEYFVDFSFREFLVWSPFQPSIYFDSCLIILSFSHKVQDSSSSLPIVSDMRIRGCLIFFFWHSHFG